LDWLSGTFPVGVTLDQALEFLGAAFQHKGQFYEGFWSPMERGAMGYRSGVAHGHMKVFSDGTEKMGVHFDMSGKGVREFLEWSGIGGDEGLRAWLECAVKAHGVVFTRCDWACDDHSKEEVLLDLDRINRAVDDGTVVSRFKTVEERRKRQLGKQRGPKAMKEEPPLVANTLYFGSIMSEMSVCFYDKAKEQIQKAKDRRDEAGERALDGVRWVRCELRAKKKRAHALVLEFIEQGIKAVTGVLRGYLDFRQVKGSDTNVTRRDTVDWWDRFLNYCDCVRLAIVKPESTIERVRSWMLNQVAPMFYAMCEVSSPQAFVHHLLEEGKARRGPRHDFLIASGKALSCLGQSAL
jgi:DNA relaxase NicK